MRSVTTRTFILLSALLIAVILAVQVHWLNKTYSFEKTEFNNSVLKSIRGVYEDMPLLYNSSLSIDSLVERYKESGFIFQVHELPSKDSLLFYLSAELEDFKVFTDCQVAMYDHGKNEYIWSALVSTDASKKGEEKIKGLPLVKRDFSYVHLFFPNRGSYIIGQMRNWIFASVILLLLLTGFAFSLYYFYQQKFLVEIQKDFINNITHEFSTPLSVIDIAADGLEKPAISPGDERYKKYVEAIKYQTDHLKSHIANLVRTAVTDKHHAEPAKKEIVPNELLKRVAVQLETLLIKANGRIEWRLEENNMRVWAVEQDIYLAFFNIINNAIKYSERPVITITTSVENANYVISIKDNGIGIAAAEQKKIFRKFYRVSHGNLHSVKGLGLGLYFTKKVVEANGGTIRVNSETGKGTSFIIELPVKD